MVRCSFVLGADSKKLPDAAKRCSECQEAPLLMGGFVSRRKSGPGRRCSECQEAPLLMGRFRLEEEIGSGAVGTTFRATRVEDGQRLAIKELFVRNGESRPHYTSSKSFGTVRILRLRWRDGVIASTKCGCCTRTPTNATCHRPQASAPGRYFVEALIPNIGLHGACAVNRTPAWEVTDCSPSEW